MKLICPLSFVVPLRSETPSTSTLTPASVAPRGSVTVRAMPAREGAGVGRLAAVAGGGFWRGGVAGAGGGRRRRRRRRCRCLRERRGRGENQSRAEAKHAAHKRIIRENDLEVDCQADVVLTAPRRGHIFRTDFPRDRRAAAAVALEHGTLRPRGARTRHSSGSL